MSAELIVALDVPKLEDAERLVKILYPTVKLFKIGSQLYTIAGPQAVQMVGKIGGKVFLDLKFHDIPNTVGNAVASCTDLSVFMLTVHIAGGEKMMESAAMAAKQRAAELGIARPKIVGITVLTSDAAAEDTQKTVVARAISAQRADLDGVVCSVQETAAVRKQCGKDFIIVTPGIRSPGDDRGDQKRVATPAEAVVAGSDYLVVGRPIVAADDPEAAALDIMRSM